MNRTNDPINKHTSATPASGSAVQRPGAGTTASQSPSKVQSNAYGSSTAKPGVGATSTVGGRGQPATKADTSMTRPTGATGVRPADNKAPVGRNDRATAQPVAGKKKELSKENKASLKKLGDYMAKWQVKDLARVMESKIVKGRRVAELPALLEFLEGRSLGLSPKDALSLSAVYVQETVAPTTKNQKNARKERFVDLQDLEDAVHASEISDTDKSTLKKGATARMDGRNLLGKVHDAVREHILNTGGSIFGTFKELAKKGQNFLKADDLQAGLKKIGLTNLSKADVDKIMQAYDENNDGKVSYMEFAGQLTGFDGDACIDDPSHWAYYIFEDIRRKISSNNKGLVEILTGKRDRKTIQDKVQVPWNDFIKALDGLKVLMRPEEEDELRDLLDANGSRGEVEIQHFAALVGLGCDANHSHADFSKHMQNLPKKDKVAHKSRTQKLREIMRMLISRNVTVQRLDLEFDHAAGRRSSSDTLPRNKFVDIVEYECDPSKKLDIKTLDEVTEMFAMRNGDVDCKSFLNALSSATAMEATRVYFFGQADMIIKKDKKINNLTDLLQDAIRNTRVNDLTEKELFQALRTLNIPLTDEEVSLMMFEYDPSGAAKNLELAEIEFDYKDWLSASFKNKRDEQKNSRYSAFDEYERNYRDNSPPRNDRRDDSRDDRRDDRNRDSRDNNRWRELARELTDALKKHSRELQDIVDAISSRHSGTLQWLKNHSRDGKTMTEREFEGAIDALKIDTRRWLVQSRDLHRDLCVGRSQDVLITDVDDMLKQIQSEPVKSKNKEENTLEAIVREFNGDERFIEDEHNALDRDRRGVTPQEFARHLEKQNPKGPTERELEDMINRYGVDSRARTPVVDIRELSREFCKLRDQRAIKAGKYDPRQKPLDDRRNDRMDNSRGDDRRMDDRRQSFKPPYDDRNDRDRRDNGPGPSNPLLPGRSENQTKSALNRRAGDRKVAPAGYRMPKHSDLRMFEEMMGAAYLEGVLIEDHFEKFAQGGGRGPKTLQDRDFEDGIKALRMRWSNKDVQNIFSLIAQAFDLDRMRGGIVLEARHIDQAVDQEVGSTIQDLQDVILRNLQSAAQAERVDLKRTIDDADRQSRGGLASQDATTAILAAFPRGSKMPEAEEIELLMRRYMRGTKLELNKLSDDLVPARPAGGRPNDRGNNDRGRFEDPRSQAPRMSPQEIKQLESLKERIANQIAQDRIQLAGAFAAQERGSSTGAVDSKTFGAILAQNKIRLSQAEEDLLIKNYEVKGQRNQVDYRTLLDDIKRVPVKNNAARGATGPQALTRDQEKLIMDIKSWLPRHDGALGKIVAEFKHLDLQQKGYLASNNIHSAFSAVGLKLGNTQVENFCKSVRPNNQGLFPYKELLELITSKQEAAALYSASVRELESGTWNKSGKAQTFKAPMSTKGALSSQLDSIGRALIASRQNYEDILLRASGEQGSGRPQITEIQIGKAFKDLRIALQREQTNELRSFFKERANRSGTVDITQFLEAVGVPAQSIGAAAQQDSSKKLLQPDELRKAAQAIYEIKQEFENARMKGREMAAFERQKISPSDQAIRPDAFLQAISKDLGRQTSSRAEDQLSLIVAYLQEDVPNQISLRKLNLALLAGQNDTPLAQHGADDVQAYQAGIRRQLTDASKGKSQGELMDFANFLSNKNLGIGDILGVKQAKMDVIKAMDFKRNVKSSGWAGDVDKLCNFMEPNTNGDTLKLSTLKNAMKQASSGKQGAQKTAEGVRSAMSRFDTKTKAHLSRISEYLRKKGMSVAELHDRLDENKDGGVDKREFLTKLATLSIPGLLPQDLGQVFDSLDINDDGSLSVHEFSLYLEGAELSRAERVASMGPDVQRQLDEEIGALFNAFDADGNGQVTADEIHRALQPYGIKRTIQQCTDMIKTAAGQQATSLDRNAFRKMMLPFLEGELCGQEESVEDLRSKFVEADIDGNGFLSVEELFHAIRKMGADVDLEDIVQLMSELDVDRNGQLDVDEFVSLLKLGDQLQFRSAENKSTYLKVKKSRRLNPLDFLKSFKDMPTNFAPSFIHEKWSTARKNLPSSVFKAQLDPATMLWKDCLEMKSEDMNPIEVKKGNKPNLRPIETSIGCALTFIDAQGVPLPQISQGSQFRDEDIIKRAVRIAVEERNSNSVRISHNAIQVPAQWKKSDEDIWSFDTSEKSLRNVIFRTTPNDQLDKGKSRLLIELVVYVKGSGNNNKVTEMCCGWCELPLEELGRQQTHKLEIHGGVPTAEVSIDSKDLRTNRSGLKFVQKVFTGDVQKQLNLEVRPYSKMATEMRTHIDLLPSTCLVHRPLLYFISGFMNYKAELLLKETAAGQFRRPPGDVVISSFPKIYDNPDIVEELNNIWSEDIQPGIDSKKLDMKYIKTKTAETISRLYPILFSDTFTGLDTAPTASMCGNTDLLDKRRKLIQSALRHGAIHQVKQKVKEAPHELTTFKPFNVRELEYDVWDCSRSKQDRFMSQFGEMGLLDNKRGSENTNSLNQSRDRSQRDARAAAPVEYANSSQRQNDSFNRGQQNDSFNRNNGQQNDSFGRGQSPARGGNDFGRGGSPVRGQQNDSFNRGGSPSRGGNDQRGFNQNDQRGYNQGQQNQGYNQRGRDPSPQKGGNPYNDTLNQRQTLDNQNRGGSRDRQGGFNDSSQRRVTFADQNRRY